MAQRCRLSANILKIAKCQKIFKYTYFIHINFFKKPNKKIYNRAKELYCDTTIFEKYWER